MAGVDRPAVRDHQREEDHRRVRTVDAVRLVRGRCTSLACASNVNLRRLALVGDRARHRQHAFLRCSHRGGVRRRAAPRRASSTFCWCAYWLANRKPFVTPKSTMQSCRSCGSVMPSSRHAFVRGLAIGHGLASDRGTSDRRTSATTGQADSRRATPLACTRHFSASAAGSAASSSTAPSLLPSSPSSVPSPARRMDDTRR